MEGAATASRRQREAADLRSTAWDFRWQDQYRYATPVFLPKGTTLSMHFTYDNSDGNPRNPQRPPQRVKWGPQSIRRDGRVVAGDPAPAPARTSRC